MTDEKRCMCCGQWSRWERREGDVCEHCGQPLMEACAVFEASTSSGRLAFHHPREGDSMMMRVARSGALVAHLAYAAIMWVFMMVTAALVH